MTRKLRSILAPVGVAMGAILSIGGYILNGQQVISLGLPIWVWQAIGAFLFFVSIIAIVYGLEKRVEAKTKEPITESSEQKVTSGEEVPESLQTALSQEQVAERHAFIQQSRAVSRRLFKNCQGGEVNSIHYIMREICRELPMREYIEKDWLAGQTVRLLTHELDKLFDQASKFQEKTEALSIASVSDASTISICNATRNLVVDYRRVVDESRSMLETLEKKGVESLWHKSPWSVRINRGLADNYDELMRLVEDLRASTPKNCQDLLPNDDQLSKFPRASLWG